MTATSLSSLAGEIALAAKLRLDRSQVSNLWWFSGAGDENEPTLEKRILDDRSCDPLHYIDQSYLRQAMKKLG